MPGCPSPVPRNTLQVVEVITAFFLQHLHDHCPTVFPASRTEVLTEVADACSLQLGRALSTAHLAMASWLPIKLGRHAGDGGNPKRALLAFQAERSGRRKRSSSTRLKFISDCSHVLLPMDSRGHCPWRNSFCQ